MEVYTLTITLLQGRFYSPWERTVEMRSDTTLFGIHDFIQDAIEFDDDHLFEFFTGRSHRNRDQVFGDGDDDYFDKKPKSLKTTLKEIYPLGRLRLYYFFDWGDSWLFELRKDRKVKQVEPGVEYPRIIEAEGDNPQQYPDLD